MIGDPELGLMKKNAILINTARGGLIDEKALYAALTEGSLYGYGADVHEKEPPTFLDLLRLDNLVSTTRMAGVSQKALINMSLESASKVIRFLNRGEIPEYILNPEALNRTGP
jgi:lactate dehydrogenase-like 2-hydroxyacid dehydrogenase